MPKVGVQRTGKTCSFVPAFGVGSGPSLAFVPPRCSCSVLCWVSPNVFPAGGDVISPSAALFHLWLEQLVIALR